MPVAAAQASEPEPTVSDADYDTSAPPVDEAYLEEDHAAASPNGEPAVANGDFDTSLPPDDQSYLTEDVPADGAGASARSETPGPGVVALLAAIGALAVLTRRS